MSIAGKVIGYLGSVFGLYPRSASVGGIVVRKRGGTPGVDEVGITFNTYDVLYRSESSVGGHLFQRGSTEIATFTLPYGSPVVMLGSGGYFCWNSSTPSAANPDTGFNRIAANVIGTNIVGGNPSWVQQTPARSRVSSAVTNTTITPANITGLSHTLIAGRKYTGRLVLYASVPTSADGIRIDFDGGTATMTSFVAQGILSDDTSTRKLARTTALATDITDTDLNGDGLVVIELGFVCNAAGTFIPRIAKEADAAGATLTVLANSFLWLEDMP